MYNIFLDKHIKYIEKTHVKFNGKNLSTSDEKNKRMCVHMEGEKCVTFNSL